MKNYHFKLSSYHTEFLKSNIFQKKPVKISNHIKIILLFFKIFNHKIHIFLHNIYPSKPPPSPSKRHTRNHAIDSRRGLQRNSGPDCTYAIARAILRNPSTVRAVNRHQILNTCIAVSVTRVRTRWRRIKVRTLHAPCSVTNLLITLSRGPRLIRTL